MSKAIALFSGGLDSTLAVLTILKQTIEVTAIKFLTPFDSKKFDPDSISIKLGLRVETRFLRKKFLEIVKNPSHGYGKNMNPCIDCRILMLREARQLMQQKGADFIITGEVLGQRPMSQRKDILYHIDKEAGVTGYVLRPLSAKLLRVTIPEAGGIVNRELLHDFNGRSRKPQMSLAGDFGLTEYEAPAGGCLLTEPHYANKLRDLLRHNSSPDMRDIELLRIGRHFRLSHSCKLIVGRDERENDFLVSLSGEEDCLIKVEDYGSPVVLVTGTATDDSIEIAASICARYSDAKNLSEVEATVIKGDSIVRLKVSPARDGIIESLRIELKSPITIFQ